MSSKAASLSELRWLEVPRLIRAGCLRDRCLARRSTPPAGQQPINLPLQPHNSTSPPPANQRDTHPDKPCAQANTSLTACSGRRPSGGLFGVE